MTTFRSLVGKATIQAFLAVLMAGLIVYGFVTGKLTSEAILPLAGAAILYFFPGQKTTK